MPISASPAGQAALGGGPFMRSHRAERTLKGQRCPLISGIADLVVSMTSQIDDSRLLENRESRIVLGLRASYDNCTRQISSHVGSLVKTNQTPTQPPI